MVEAGSARLQAFRRRDIVKLTNKTNEDVYVLKSTSIVKTRNTGSK
jgi:hypothetical protein